MSPTTAAAMRALTTRHAVRRFCVSVQATKAGELSQQASGSIEDARKACITALGLVSGADSPGDASVFASVFHTALSHNDAIADPDILTSIAEASRFCPALCRDLTRRDVPNAALSQLLLYSSGSASESAAPPSLVPACNALTAFLDIQMHPNVEWFERVGGVSAVLDLIDRFPSDIPLRAAGLHLLSAAMRNETTAQAHVERVLPLAEGCVSLENIFNQRAQAVVQGALALLRQLAALPAVGARVDLSVASAAVRVIRADIKDWESVDHAVGLLANLRDRHKKTGFAPGSIEEPDFVLTLLDAAQVHSSDPWLVAGIFKFMCGLSKQEPGFRRIGLHHASVVKQVLTDLSRVADVQAYGCIAIAIAAKSNTKPFLQTGLIEHAELVRRLFAQDAFVANSASYLLHNLRNRSEDAIPNFVAIPQEWDKTIGGPGTMLKLEGQGMTTYLGLADTDLTPEQQQAFAAQARARGLDAVDEDYLPFSDDESQALPLVDPDSAQDTTPAGRAAFGGVDVPSDEEVPDFELLDDDSDGRQVMQMVAEELQELVGDLSDPEEGAEITELPGYPDLEVQEGTGQWLSRRMLGLSLALEAEEYEKDTIPFQEKAQRLKAAVNKEMGALPDGELHMPEDVKQLRAQLLAHLGSMDPAKLQSMLVQLEDAKEPAAVKDAETSSVEGTVAAESEESTGTQNETTESK